MIHWTEGDVENLRLSMKNAGTKVSDALKVFNKMSQKIDLAGRTLSTITGGVSRILSQSVSQITGPASSIEGFAMQMKKVMELPSKVIDAPRQIISTYRDMAKNLILKFKKDPFSLERTKNSLATLKMTLGLSLFASCKAATYSVSQIGSDGATGIKNRQDAIAVAEDLRDFYDEISEFLDEQTAENFSIESGDFAENLLRLVKMTESAILNAAFSLSVQKTIILDRDRQMLELCAELYGDVDGKIEDFIRDNDLTLDEMQIIKAGREIVWTA